MRFATVIIAFVLISCSEQNESIYFNEYGLLNSSSKYNLFIFFSEQDCLACLTEISSYNKLYKNIHERNLSITGITNIKNDSLRNEFIRENDIGFGVVENHKIFNKYVIGRTPQSILIDVKHNNIIVYRSFRKKTLSSQRASYDIINLIVRNSF